ncbi:phytoene desaturase family protein [Sphingomonas sp. 37zxx]|uniref:phytoene desaturase family protein n=1 Tax=Sphingomonas sp. 37zxx TaxID=1550073 RepID=UPI00053BD952|nr:NAD(P)-binding protein [Sphingomonas sp. 37zxx]
MARDQMVIIGAGIGGLVAAALLGARGYAVTVVEAQSRPGGKLRAIDVVGNAIDAGPTVFTLRDVFADIFTACGSAIDDPLTLRPATILARHAWSDDRLDLFADPARSEAAIGDFAGASAARDYRSFRTEAARIFDALDPAFMRRPRADPLTLAARLAMRRVGDAFALRPYESLWRALGEHFADPRLQQLFGRYATYCGSSPFACPAERRPLGAMVWLTTAQASGFPLTRHNVFFSPDYPAEFNALAAQRPAADPSVYVCAQDRDDLGNAPAGPERFQINVNAPPIGDTQKLPPQEIESCTQAMHRRLSQAGLSLGSAVGETRLLTPTDFEVLCPSTGGALYGRASRGWAVPFLRQGSRTRIPGLYCAGGSCHPGAAGLPMAPLSASLAVDCLAADHASTSWFRRRAMPGGISTPPAMTANTG